MEAASVTIFLALGAITAMDLDSVRNLNQMTISTWMSRLVHASTVQRMCIAKTDLAACVVNANSFRTSLAVANDQNPRHPAPTSP